MSKNTGSRVIGGTLMFFFAPACVAMNGWWGTGIFMFIVGMIIFFKGET